MGGAPEMTASREWSSSVCRDVLEALPADQRLVLPALQRVQETFGFVPDEAVPLVAEALNVSVADTHGVLTFYHDLRRSAPASVTVAVCVAEACQANGARDLVAHVEDTVAKLGGRSGDGQIEVREVYCLGNCALGPAVMVNGRLIGRVTPDRIAQVLAEATEMSAR